MLILKLVGIQELAFPQPRWLIITYQLRLTHPDMDSGEISPYLDEAFTIEIVVYSS